MSDADFADQVTSAARDATATIRECMETIDRLTRERDEARDKALEEAASIIEAYSRADCDQQDRSISTLTRVIRSVSRTAAADIRALKGKPSAD